MERFRKCSAVSKILSSLNVYIRKNICLGAVREGLLASNSKSGALDKQATYYISCASSDKGIAKDRAFDEADGCLVIMTAKYYNELKKKGANVARDYPLIRNYFSISSESTKVILLPLEDAPRDMPDCLKVCNSISLVESLYYWILNLIRLLIQIILLVVTEYLGRCLFRYLLPYTVEDLGSLLVDCLLHYLQHYLSKYINYSKL